MSTRKLAGQLFLLLATAAAGCASEAGGGDSGKEDINDGPRPYFQGRTIQIVVGFGPGGGFDKYARVTANHLGDHIPGNPTIEVVNMPNPDNAPGLPVSVAATNHLFAAEPDGLTLATFNPAVIIQQLLETPGIEFDAAAFDFLGAPGNDLPACGIRADVGGTSWADIHAADPGRVVGHLGPGSTGFDVARIMNHLTGSQLQLEGGFSSSSELVPAAMSGSTDIACFTWSGLERTAAAELAAGTFVPFLAAEGEPDLASVTTIESQLGGDPVNEAVVGAWLNQFKIHWLLATPPGVDPEVLAALQTGWSAMVADEAFIAEATAQKLVVSPRTGPEVQAIVDEMFSLDEGHIETLQNILGE
jgi:tripartite-type tricarboxylate transporter receptor subunit TctC